MGVLRRGPILLIGFASAMVGCGRLGFAPPGGDGTSDDVGDGSTAASPCTAAHAFCADFDTGTNVAAGWDDFQVDPTTQITLDGASVVSSPSSMLLAMARATGMGKYGILTRRMAGSWTRLHLELDMYAETPPWQTGDGQVGLIVFLMRSWTNTSHSSFSTSHGGTLALWPDSSSMTFKPLISYEDPRATFHYSLAPVVLFDRWVHIVFDVTLAGTVSWEIDGVPGAASFTPATSAVDPFVSISIGRMDWNSPTTTNGGSNVRFDNVVMDLQ